MKRATGAVMRVAVGVMSGANRGRGAGAGPPENVK